ncbi:hypothetical protein SCLCIDRAFT_1208172 [Scleroderma citrinum Foug A]|uniref:PWWP domain-containing protein n=1 Tax=Scleroderma citrinum Foug A TaxID=1036808 RepID=A0A0C3ENB8_9AGAM|nr:hypothetical protein SCLCIDRAFT_1208172 [Scleroderma citrinum Foug A]
MMSKKAAKNQEPETTYVEREIVLAKVRGFPPWPGMVVNPDNVPSSVSKERPTGKKATFYCVRFFPAGDYAWLVSKDISKLKDHEIQAYISEPHKKNADLLAGYRIAVDPQKWEKERENAELIAAEQEDNAPVDQLDSEQDEDDKKLTKPKKRKRESDAAAKPKAKTKPKSDKKVSAKGRKNGAKSKEMVESEDDGDQDAEGEGGDVTSSAKAAPPPSKKPKREKEEDIDAKLESDPEARKVREWRHKLQKALLGSKGLPSPDEMPALDQLFATVEKYEHPNIISYLSFSKIGKVMRHIAALTPEKVPRDDEFHFRTRAKALVDKWHTILGSSKTTEAGGEAVPNGAPVDGAPVSPMHNSTSAGGVPEGENAGDVSMLSAA